MEYQKIINIAVIAHVDAGKSTLVNAFLKNFSTKLGKRLAGIRKAAMDALVGYRWPGNVRELQNIIERIVVL